MATVPLLTVPPPYSQQCMLEQLISCPQDELLQRLRHLKVQTWERMVAASWQPLLSRCETILASAADPATVVDEELLCEVLRVVHDMVSLHPDLKGPVEKLRDLLQRSELQVLLGALRCLAVCPPSRHLQSGPQASALERRLEMLACGGAPSLLDGGSLRDACTATDYVVDDFRFELPASSTEREGSCDTSDELSVLVTTAEAPEGPEAFETLRQRLEASHSIPSASRSAFLLQLRLWCRSRTLEGRREVVAIALFAICNAVKHIRPFVLQQYMQKRPGLLSELCELLQLLQVIGSDAGVAALRVTGGFLDSRFGQSRSEASQLSQMLGLSLPHGIVACALRGLLAHRPEADQLEEHNKVLLATFDLFQITTVNNHQTTAQLGHAGMLHSMLELMEKMDVASLTVVTWMLRCLELVSEVSGTAALVLFRDFGGLQAFSVRLHREIELIMALEDAEKVVDSTPPPDTAEEEEKKRFRDLFEETTLRRRLCRQLLKNIQTALQCSEVVQGLASVFQGQLTDALKLAVKAPMKMGLQLFGTAIDIVSSIIQDDPSRVPQMIETDILPAIMAAVNKETLKSVECLNFVPGLLASIAMHAVGENFILSLSPKPIQLLTEAFTEISYAGIMHTQPELVQIMGTQVEKVLRNRPAGPSKLTEHVVDCMLDTMRAVAVEAKAYPEWTPLDLEDRSNFLPDRLAPLCRFCWSILSTNESALKCFLERKGLSVVRELQELPCLPFHLTSLEGQQHPMASLFNLQVKGSDGNLAVPAAELKEMLSSHLEVVPTLQECMAEGDPAVAIAKMESTRVVSFLRTLSRATAALESMLSVCRECSSTQVMEAVREPLREIGPLAASLFVLVAWHPQERERLPATASYHETVRAVFSPSSAKDGKDGLPVGLPAAPAGDGSKTMEVENDTAGAGNGSKVPSLETSLLRAARQCFRLTSRTLRQLLQLATKLHSRRMAGSSSVPPGLARQLAQVAKTILSAKRPENTAAALRWVAEVFDVLHKMHEEQNKVAVRPMALCTFYQAGGFDLLPPLIRFVVEELGKDDDQLAGAALMAATSYFEKLTAPKRYAHAMEIRPEEGLMWKEQLCHSVQACAVKSLLPIWQHPQCFTHFPRAACGSLLKVWLQLAVDEEVTDKLMKMKTSKGDFTPVARGTHGPPSRRARAAQTARSAAGSAAQQEAETQVQGTLVDMGFSAAQAEAALNHFPNRGSQDIGQLIMWMVSNPLDQVNSDAGKEVLVEPVKDLQEIRDHVMQDLLQRMFAVGYEVPKALPSVVDTICSLSQIADPLWPKYSLDDDSMDEDQDADPNSGSEEEDGFVGKSKTKDKGKKPMKDLKSKGKTCGKFSDCNPKFGSKGTSKDSGDEADEEEERTSSSKDWSRIRKDGDVKKKGLKDFKDKSKGDKKMEKLERAGKLERLKSLKDGKWDDKNKPLVPVEPVDTDHNLKVILVSCLRELHGTPTPEKLSCVTQVLANLLHRRPAACRILGERKGRSGEHGMKLLLERIHNWCVEGIDFTKSPEERGHRLIHGAGRAPAPPGLGEALLPAPSWFTPAVVCAQQLLCKAELVKYGDGTQVLDTEIQQMWVTLALDILYAFPGSDGALAQTCLQVLIRLCGASVGSKAFLSYQLSPRFAVTEGPETGIRALQLLLRLGKQANFPGLFQMLAEFLSLLLEDGPALQQRMENEILQSFGSRRTMPARDLCRMNHHLLSRNPCLFEEALKSVTQKSRDDMTLTIELIPEGERPLRQRMRFGALPSALPILQTLVNELCFGVDVQCRTSFQKLYEAANKADGNVEETKGASNALPPPFPFALGPISILYVMDTLLGRSQGLSSMLLKPPLTVPPLEATIPEDKNSLVITSVVPQHKSLLLLMMRHLLPKLAQLSELWSKQMNALNATQKSALSSALNPVQRLLPHLAAVLCSVSRHPGEPRRALVAEAVVTLRSLAEGPKSPEEEGEYGTQVSTASIIVARLLSAVPPERKEEKDAAGADAQDPSSNASPRLNALDHPSGSTASAPPAKKARTRKDSGHFTTANEMQALRDAFGAVLTHLPLQRSEATTVASSVLRCLELLTRRDFVSTGAASGESSAVSGGVAAPQEDQGHVPMDLNLQAGESLGSRLLESVQRSLGEALRREEMAAEEEDGDGGEDEEEDDDMGENGEEGIEEDEDDDEGGEMDHMDGEEHHVRVDEGEEDDEDEEGEYEDPEDMEEDYDMNVEEFTQDAQGIESVLQNAIQVFDQEHPRMEGESMTFRVDIDLGEAGVIQGLHRGGQFRRMQMPPPPGLRAGTAVGFNTAVGWEAEMEPPAEHPLLRREPAIQHGEDRAQWMPTGNLRQYMSNLEPIIRNSSASSSPQNAAGSQGNEDFEAIFMELAPRLGRQLRMSRAAEAAPVVPPPGSLLAPQASEVALPVPPVPPEPDTPFPAPSVHESPRNNMEEDDEATPHPAANVGSGPIPPSTGGNVSSADTSMNISSTNQGPPAGAPVPAVPVAPVAPAAPAPPPPQTEANALAAAFASVGTAAGGVSTPNQAAPGETAPPETTGTAPAAAEDDSEAAALGILELARLARRLGCTQTAILQSVGIDMSVVAALPEEMRSSVVMAEISQARLDHLRQSPQVAPQAQAAEPAEIDAVVLEALPPEIREEVLQEEAARQRSQAPPAPPEGTRTAPSNEMDNASFIASLDPMLREEVLLSAPEEVLRTLPAELVAEAQLLRDRAFTRIALRRDLPPPVGRLPGAPPVAQEPGAATGTSTGTNARPAQAWPRQHAHLSMIEQQLLHHNTGNRRWSGPIGMQRPRVPGEPLGLNSFDEADQQLLKSCNLDEVNVEVPISPTLVPGLCRLLYLRTEVSTIPLTRLCFNLSLHPTTRSALLGHFMVLLCKHTEADAPMDALPPPCLFGSPTADGLETRSPLEVQSVGAQRILAMLAYLLRRVPHCGDFFAHPLGGATEAIWLHTVGSRSKASPDRKKKQRLLEAQLRIQNLPLANLPKMCSVNLLMQLVNTRLYLSSSRHAAWLLSVLHALLVPQPEGPSKVAEVATQTDPPAAPPPEPPTAPTPETAVPIEPAPVVPAAPAAPANAQRWTKIIEDMHLSLTKDSVLALCHFLCHAGSGHGSNSEGDAFQLAGDILVALAGKVHLELVRGELMKVLSILVTDIEKSLDASASVGVASVSPSTVESRFLRVVRTLTEVFRSETTGLSSTEKVEKGDEKKHVKPEAFEEARVETLWRALDQALERLQDDAEASATPAQKLLSGPASTVRLELQDANQSSPPKPLLNRLLPLIEAFFVLHGRVPETMMNPTDPNASPENPASPEREDGKVSNVPHVFAELHEQSAAEKSRFGKFCKKHRRPLNALLKQTPSLLSKSFAPVLQLMPSCLDFDNKRAYFRAQLRSRRLESRYQTIRLRVRRNEIFMDSYHQLRIRTGEEMRAKIQVQFQGEEGIDAGGVAKEWYGALAKEIFNPNYALFVQAGGKACTYHPNPMSYVNRDHLQFFHFIGRVVGKAIHDGQNLEAWFTRGFYKHMLGKKVIPADLEAFDPEYFSNLKWMLDHDITNIIELNFSAESDELGQMKVVDLKPEGRSLPVTNDNKHEYIQLMSEHKMTNSVKQQIEHFLKGLHEIVPPQLLSLFDDKELELLISGLPDIDIEDLKQNTEYHNYTPQSDQVQWFWKVLSEFTQEQRAWFLQFATGTSRVPVEGFKGLVGMRGPQKFSLHRAYGADRLPSAHTCFNQVDLPEYPSEEVLREKLLQAVSEGHEGFGFA